MLLSASLAFSGFAWANEGTTSPANLQIIERDRVIRGKKMEIKVMLDKSVAPRSRFMQRLAPDIALDKIEDLEKMWSPIGGESQVARINEFAGLLPVRINDPTFQLLKRSVAACKASNRAYDPTFYSAGKLFNRSPTPTEACCIGVPLAVGVGGVAGW